jgi:hypothetical protein
MRKVICIPKKIVRISDGKINNRNLRNYDENGYIIYDDADFGDYINISKYKKNGDKTVYMIYELKDLVDPSKSYNDSTTYEYYDDKVMKVYFGLLTQINNGKKSNKLIKQLNKYNAAGTLISMSKYDYTIDALGLISARTVQVYSQPSGALSSTIKDVYTYEKYK